MFFGVSRRPTGREAALRQQPQTATLKNMYRAEYMSFLYHKRTTKILQWIWGVVAILVSLGMVIFFAPGLPQWLASFF